MDEDARGRGKPTVDVACDEATAILAGDALQSLAFELLARAPLPAQARVEMLAELAQAKASLRLSQKNYERAVELLSRHAGTGVARDQTRSEEHTSNSSH